MQPLTPKAIEFAIRSAFFGVTGAFLPRQQGPGQINLLCVPCSMVADDTSPVQNGGYGTTAFPYPTASCRRLLARSCGEMQVIGRTSSLTSN
jgi:hypothetical protein